MKEGQRGKGKDFRDGAASVFVVCVVLQANDEVFVLKRKQRSQSKMHKGRRYRELFPFV